MRLRTSRLRGYLCTLVLAAVLLMNTSVFAAEPGIAVMATLASEYIYRGQAVSDGNPAVQLGIDYQHHSGWFGGVWASTIDIRTPFSYRDLEVDYYLGYRHEFAAPLALSATLMRFTYPGQEGAFDYDYDLLLMSAALLETYSLEFGYTDNIYGFGRIGRHWELRANWPVRNTWSIGTGLGRNDLDEIRTDAYAYWDLGVSARYSRVTMDLRWHDNEAPEGLLSQLSAGSRIVVSLTATF